MFLVARPSLNCVLWPCPLVRFLRHPSTPPPTNQTNKYKALGLNLLNKKSSKPSQFCIFQIFFNQKCVDWLFFCVLLLAVGGAVVMWLSLPIGAVHGGLGGQPLACLLHTLTKLSGLVSEGLAW